TAITFRLHPLGPTVLAGSLVYEWKRVHDALRLYGEFSAAAPDALCGSPAICVLSLGLRGMQHPSTKEFESGAAVHGPLQHLEATDLSLHGTGRPRQLERRADGSD